MFRDTGIRRQKASSNGEAIDADASATGENNIDVNLSDESETETFPDSGPPDSREAELNWIDEHVDDSSELAGKWVVLQGSRLVSSSLDLSTAMDEARKVGVNHPFVFRVPNDRENLVSP